MKTLFVLATLVMSLNSFAQADGPSNSSVTTSYSRNGLRVMNKSIKCARSVLFEHKGSVEEMVQTIKLLQKVQAYLSSSNPNGEIELGPIELAYDNCAQLNKSGFEGYALQEIVGLLETDTRPMNEKLFSILDSKIKMSFQLRKIVQNLVENTDDYRGLGQLDRVRSLLAVPADL